MTGWCSAAAAGPPRNSSAPQRRHRRWTSSPGLRRRAPGQRGPPVRQPQRHGVDSAGPVRGTGPVRPARRPQRGGPCRVGTRPAGPAQRRGTGHDLSGGARVSMPTADASACGGKPSKVPQQYMIGCRRQVSAGYGARIVRHDPRPGRCAFTAGQCGRYPADLSSRCGAVGAPPPPARPGPRRLPVVAARLCRGCWRWLSLTCPVGHNQR
jgi:hypothetical protein